MYAQFVRPPLPVKNLWRAQKEMCALYGPAHACTDDYFHTFSPSRPVRAFCKFQCQDHFCNVGITQEVLLLLLSLSFRAHFPASACISFFNSMRNSRKKAKPEKKRLRDTKTSLLFPSACPLFPHFRSWLPKRSPPKAEQETAPRLAASRKLRPPPW